MGYKSLAQIPARRNRPVSSNVRPLFSATVNFIFRLPHFPVILDTKEKLVFASTRTQLVSRITELQIQDEDKRDIIDSNAEGFAFYPKIDTISPSIGIRRWNKRQIIKLFNARRTAGTPEVRSNSLSSRSLESIVVDAIYLLRDNE